MGFLDDDFLLSTGAARRLYTSLAEGAPIVDFHNHLSARAIAEDQPFESLSALWLDGDHYKWRAMRGAGIPEELISGQADDRERFRAWARTVPSTALNPLYHWTHLELRRAFGIDALLGPDTADAIYDQAAEQLSSPEFSPRGLLRRFGVTVACTTDDPADSLEYHEAIARKTQDFRVLPTFRPDRAGDVSQPRQFDSYLIRLSEAAGLPIRSPQGFLDALEARHTAFHEAGCRASDHGFDGLWDAQYEAADIETIWQRVRAGRKPSQEECRVFQTWVAHETARLNVDRGWVSQYHLGPLRNVNSGLFELLGPDSGGDTVGDPLSARDMAGYLDSLDRAGHLARTLLYNIRGSDSEMVASIAGAFNDGSSPGKVQPGAAWWFADTEGGIRRQLRAISDVGLLRHSVGMVTDSRSFLSLVRHEYFRRILCDEIGIDIQKGLLPDDEGLLRDLINGITHANALAFFGFA
ncbi:MAG: glucuronate isomerase [Rhodothermales bacterium]|jgi:glucuronate isomerase